MVDKNVFRSFHTIKAIAFISILVIVSKAVDSGSDCSRDIIILKTLDYFSSRRSRGWRKMVYKVPPSRSLKVFNLHRLNLRAVYNVKKCFFVCWNLCRHLALNDVISKKKTSLSRICIQFYITQRKTILNKR